MDKLPIYESISQYLKREPFVFHMPGHRMGELIRDYFIDDILKYDLTELPGLDNLHNPKDCIKEAMKMASNAFRSDKTYFLVNGSTCGINAAILSVCNKGDSVLVQRNSHKSVFGALALAGANPVYLKTDYNDLFGIPTIVSPFEIESAIKDNPNVAAVLITSPSYYGICMDLENIERVVHKYNKILIVDEAHGAHLVFSKKLPRSSMEIGADISIQSVHKTLPSLTGSALLHVKGTRVDISKIKQSISILQTSSPSYLMLLSIDIARYIMQEYGEKLINNMLLNIEDLIDTIKKFTNINVLEENKIKNIKLDKTKIVLNFFDYGFEGFKVRDILWNNYNIMPEMSDFNNVVLYCTVSNRKNDYEALKKALVNLNIEKKNKNIKEIINNLPGIPKMMLTLEETIKRSSKKVPLNSSLGMIAKNMITPYPPGIPVICPGEIITKEVIDYICCLIEYNSEIEGLDDKEYIEVVI